MFKKTVKFEDFNGVEQEKDFYFHLSQSELVGMYAAGEDFQDHLRKIIESKDLAAILVEFKKLVSMAVGVRSEDGGRFIKDTDAKSQLMDSPAFDELLFQLISDPSGAAEFATHLLPKKMQQEVIEQTSKGIDPFVEPKDDRPAYQKEHRKPTDVEMRNMSQAEMFKAWAFAESLNK